MSPELFSPIITHELATTPSGVPLPIAPRRRLLFPGVEGKSLVSSSGRVVCAYSVISMFSLQLELKLSKPLGKRRVGLVYAVDTLAISPNGPSFETESLRKELAKLCLKVRETKFMGSIANRAYYRVLRIS